MRKYKGFIIDRRIKNGGARVGAGRPAKSDTADKQRLTVVLHRDVIERLKCYGKSKSTFIDNVLKKELGL